MRSGSSAAGTRRSNAPAAVPPLAISSSGSTAAPSSSPAIRASVASRSTASARIRSLAAAASRASHPVHAAAAAASERCVLQDLAYISDWLLAVRSSPSLAPFASIVSRVRKCIFMPQQSRASRAAAEWSSSTHTQHTDRGRASSRPSALSSSRDGSRLKSRVAAAVAAGGGKDNSNRGISDGVMSSSASRSPAPFAASSVNLSAAVTAASTSSSPPPARSGESEDEEAESVSEDMTELHGLEERLSAFAELKEAADGDSEQSSSGSAIRAGHRAQQPSLAPQGVLFLHGRWISQQPQQQQQQPAASPAASPSLSPPSPPPAQPQPQLQASPSSTAAVGAFPDDLDALPDWPDDDDDDDDDEAETESEAESVAVSQQQQVEEAQRPSSASVSRSSVNTAASTKSDDWDDLEAVVEPLESAASAASPPSFLSSSLSVAPPRCSPQLAEKLRLFPDDTTVAELQELDDDDDDDDAESDGQGEARADEEENQGAHSSVGSGAQQAAGGEAVGAAAASASRLRDRLLRVSMGGAERFPHDIDRLEAAHEKQQPQLQPQPPPAASQLSSAARSVLSPSSSSLSASPFSRVLNEFSLSPSLIAELRLQEQQHRRADAGPQQQQQQQGAAVSRALQLLFIMQQASRLQH